MGKLFLLEDDDVVITPEVKEEIPQEEVVNPASQLLSNLIKDEWEAIDGYNATIATLNQFEGTEHLREVLEEIKGEEFVHVGQLEDLLKSIAPEAAKIAEGPSENEEMKDNAPDMLVPTEEVEVEA